MSWAVSWAERMARKTLGQDSSIVKNHVLSQDPREYKCMVSCFWAVASLRYSSCQAIQSSSRWIQWIEGTRIGRRYKMRGSIQAGS